VARDGVKLEDQGEITDLGSVNQTPFPIGQPLMRAERSVQPEVDRGILTSTLS
jgi:hypothetical protein